MKGAAGLLILLLSVSAQAADWPHWRGPQHNGISAEKGWQARWPREGPPVVWKAAVGTGFSSVSVVKGRLYTMGHDGGKDIVVCLDALTGKPIWKHSYDAELGDNNFEGGPTATPTVDGEDVFTLSRWGDAFCLAADTGKPRWGRNVQKEEEMPIPSWGFAGSPMVVEGLVLLNVGEAGVALDKKTGKTVWTSQKNEAGYSTPFPYRRGEDQLAIFTSGTAYTAVNVKSGKPRWSFRWITRYGVNATDPILAGDLLFISTGYSKGATLLQLGKGEPEQLWRVKTMRNQMNPSVLLDGHVYGVDGDTTATASLKCVELKTGKEHWAVEEVGAGSVMAADGKLIVLSESGELLIAPASPEKFAPTARAQVLQGKCWTVPVLSGGMIYCRNAAGDLVCIDVRAGK